MRHFLFIFLLISVNSFGQKLQWIPFNWEGDSISGKYFDKLAITVPVTLDNLPDKLKMQFDLGAVTTVIYGNSIKLYLEKYGDLKNKIDTTLKFRIQSQTNFMFKNVQLKLGDVSFGSRNIGHFKNFGDDVSSNSIATNTPQTIGTIAPDLFRDKILIIDYPNKRMCVVSELPKKFANAQFREFKMTDGRIKIPITMNGEDESLMFDTGSSLFALITTTEKANEISNRPIVDSLRISSWGEYYMVYGRPISSTVKFGQKQLNKLNVYFDKRKENSDFYKEEGVWGITGNAYFLKNVVIVDYKNKRFGVQ